MKTGAILTLRGPHPYYPHDFPEVEITLPLHAEVPGKVVGDRNVATVAERHDRDSWTAQAGPYATIATKRTGRAQANVERKALLRLVWDLRGEPIHPALPKRRAVEFAAVMDEDGGVEIWRRTCEMLCEREAKVARIRNPHGSLRPVRRKAEVAA